MTNPESKPATLSPDLEGALHAAFEGLLDDPSEVASTNTIEHTGGFDDARRALDDLVSRALAYRMGPELKELLSFTHRFPHIAPYNAMLLHVQNPGICYALRAPVWKRRYKRRVRPGSRPYLILQTMGLVAFVFDISDTEPIDPSVDLVPQIVENPFPTKGKPPAGALSLLIAACWKIAIRISFPDFATNLAGRIIRSPHAPPDFEVQINSKHTEAQQLGTLSHELAHAFCGHLGQTELGFWANRLGLPCESRELEAEAVAYLVTDRLNLDIGSVQYLAGYLDSEVPLPDYSLDAVLKAAGKIEEMLQDRFRPKKKKPRVPP